MPHADLHDPSHAQPHEARRPWWQPRASLVVISAALILAAALIPARWIERFGGLFDQGPARVRGAFSNEAASLEAVLSDDSPLEDAQRALLAARRADLQLRMLAKLGPMTGEDVARVRAQLPLDNAQVDAERAEASKRATRRALSRRLAATLPRHDPDGLVQAMDDFDARLARRLGQPSP